MLRLEHQIICCMSPTRSGFRVLSSAFATCSCWICVQNGIMQHA